jgi:hypothetical protein
VNVYRLNYEYNLYGILCFHVVHDVKIKYDEHSKEVVVGLR